MTGMPRFARNDGVVSKNQGFPELLTGYFADIPIGLSWLQIL